VPAISVITTTRARSLGCQLGVEKRMGFLISISSFEYDRRKCIE
jgi:hypothetical protein